MQNHTWESADLPPGKKPLGCKWIIKRKLKVGELMNKYNARLIIRGYKENERLDYFGTYSLVTKITSFRW